MENGYEECSKEHDWPLVRWRRRGGGAFLRQDLPRFIRRRGASRTGRLSVREERGCVDGRFYRDGDSLSRAQWRTCIQAQRSILVSGRNRRPGRNRSLLERNRRQRRPSECVRVAPGQKGVVLADYA